jgi:hypothetical protein
METGIQELRTMGMHPSLAAAVVHGCHRIKNIRHCMEVTIPTLVQVGQILIHDQSRDLHFGMVGLGVNKDMQEKLRRFLWQHGVHYSMCEHHTVELYHESFEQGLRNRSECFKIDLIGNKDHRSVATDIYLEAIVKKAACPTHGLVSSHVMALAIQYRD